MAGPHPPEVHGEDSGILVATVGSYVILINGGDLREPVVKGLRAAFDSMRAHEKVGYLVVLESEVALALREEARTEIAAILADHARVICGVAIVFEGTGFKATGVRSVSTGIQLSSGTSFPHKNFSDLAEAMAWLAGHLPARTVPSRSQLPAVVAELRQRARQK